MYWFFSQNDFFHNQQNNILGVFINHTSICLPTVWCTILIQDAATPNDNDVPLIRSSFLSRLKNYPCLFFVYFRLFYLHDANKT